MDFTDDYVSGEHRMSQQDWMLMHRVAAGEETAVAELYDRFETLVFKVSRQLLPTKAEAEIVTGLSSVPAAVSATESGALLVPSR